MTSPIPQPPAIPFLGNVLNVEAEVPVRSHLLLSKQYGEIYQLNILGNRTIFANTYDLLNELSDDSRFKKVVAGPLAEVRRAGGDGLFTARLEEPNWAVAHRILMPAFGPAAVADMYAGMMDICSQLLLKWERFGADQVFDATEDFTRLTYDTIAICAMDYRFNSFYTPDLPDFVRAMGDFLSECFARPSRPSLVNRLTSSKYDADAEFMLTETRKIIAQRRTQGDKGKKDLLDRLLHGRDPKTGQGLSEENIAYQLLTFIIAGHETTSGSLGFVIHNLLTHPDAMTKLRTEVDAVVGDQVVTLEHIGHMQYLTAVIRESMRLFPAVTGRTVVPLQDTTLLNGKYQVKEGDIIRLLVMAAQRDTAVWGADAEKFRPERLFGEKFDKLPPHAWQPFGYGLRACIGRAFAWQELHLVLASVIQRFDLQLADPASYSLHIKSQISIKPKLPVRATLRTDKNPILPSPSSGLRLARTGLGSEGKAVASVSEGKQVIYVLYGSNTGTCEAFAQKVVTAAPSYGFSAQMGALDTTARALPTDGPVVILTASYEGEPADNAGHFVSWLTSLKQNELQGVKYTVFGAGNRDWAATYQKIPKICDTTIEARGGTRLLARGEGDAGGSEFFQAFDEYETKLWDVLVKEYGTTKIDSTGLSMKFVDAGVSRASALRQTGITLSTVVENRVLTARGAPVKRHIELELPEGISYQSGDYLAVLPVNPDASVRRVLARFSIGAEQEIVLSSGGGPTSLPLDKPVAVGALLNGYVELLQPASVQDLHALAKHTSSLDTRKKVEALAAAYSELVVAVRLSVLDVLERHPDIDLPFTVYLQMLPFMRIRQYSISSSPLWNAMRITLTISVVQAPALAGAEEFLGVGSCYLAGLKKGDKVPMSIRPSNAAFHLPVDPTVPIVMFCAGSGFAPFRGFCQERAMQRKAGRETGKMLLFFGCRSPDEDFLYSAAELREWVDLGVVDLRPTFSRRPAQSEDCKYVQDRTLHDAEDIRAAYAAGAKFYVCGSSKVAAGVKGSLVKILRDVNGLTESEAVARFDSICKGRFATDVFA